MSTLAQLQTLITALGDGENNTAEELRAVLNAFSTSVFLTGDIKEVDCTNEDIIANFDATGLGINERVGWAICNGLNGTKDRNGRIGMGYGAAYPVMGVTGGSKDTSISIPVSGYGVGADSGGNPSGTLLVSSGLAENGEFLESVKKAASAPTGQTIPDKNLQPYIITLFIQKL